MIILLHRHHPRDVVESHRAETEVCVVRDLAHFRNECIQIRGGEAVDSGDEVGRGEAVLIRRGATTLSED